MIIVKIKAGLGNQMFEYACGRALALRNNDVLKLDLSIWADGKPTDRPYGLSYFNIVEDPATIQEIDHIKFPFGLFFHKVANKVKYWLGIHDHSSAFHPSIKNKKGNAYLDGYWQSEKYFDDFADRIRKDFQPKRPIGSAAQSMMRKIKSDKIPVSLHIRRGDNANSPASMRIFGCPGIEYYQATIKAMRERLGSAKSKEMSLYIFSDDIEWAKANLKTDMPMTFVSGPGIETPEEITLMSACTHHIISNSTFSWWGAWLGQNPDRIVVAPKRWVLIGEEDFRDLIPDNWIKI